MAKEKTRGERHGEEDSERGAGTRVGRALLVLGVAICLGMAAWASLGGERRGQVSGTVRTLADGAQDASTNVQGQLVKARTSAVNLGLEQTVGSRLHGDKTLGSEKIEIRVEDASTVVLKGLVPDEASKEKAVALARDTRGVQKVVDHLAITPAPRVIDASAPAGPAVATRPRSLR